jgi:hypothetical protein
MGDVVGGRLKNEPYSDTWTGCALKWLVGPVSLLTILGNLGPCGADSSRRQGAIVDVSL